MKFLENKLLKKISKKKNQAEAEKKEKDQQKKAIKKERKNLRTFVKVRID